MSKFNNMSVQQIIANIEDLRADIHENAKKICEALVELRRLRVKHPLHEDKVFSWFEKIASGRLHYGVVEMFNGRSSYIKHVIDRPMDVQRTIAAKREFDIVIVKRGELQDVRKDAYKMSLSAFQRLFPLGKPPATVAEQRAALEAELAAKPAPEPTHTSHGPIVRADRARNVLKIGRQEVPLSVIEAALAEVGLVVQERPQDDLNLDLLA